MLPTVYFETVIPELALTGQNNRSSPIYFGMIGPELLKKNITCV